MLKEHLTENDIGDEKNGNCGEQHGGEGVRGRRRRGQEKGELCQVKADVEQARIDTKLANQVKPASGYVVCYNRSLEQAAHVEIVFQLAQFLVPPKQD